MNTTELERIVEIREQLEYLQKLNWLLIYAAGGEIEISNEMMLSVDDPYNRLATDTTNPDKVIWKAYKQQKETK